MRYPYIKRLPKFEYVAPKTLEEAVAFLSQFNGKARPIAGGTDILLKMKRREAVPSYLVGLKNISGLDYIVFDESQGLRFGPLVSLHKMETSSLVKAKYPILSYAASTIGSIQIRNLGTVVGNVCNALPSADMIPSLIILGAKVKVANGKNEKLIAIGDLFPGPGETILGSDELVEEVQVPILPAHSGGAYIKHTPREAMDLAIVSVATLITLSGDICSDVKICLGTVGPTPIRAIKAEQILRGKPFSNEGVKEASEMASSEVQPRSTMRGSAQYRKEMVKVLTERALNKARQEIKE